MTRKTSTIIIILLIATLAFLGYYFYTSNIGTGGEGGEDTESPLGGFWPFGRGTVTPSAPVVDTEDPDTDGDDDPLPPIEIPKLRKLSDFAVGGFYATSTASSTSIARYVHRGTGHVYEAVSDDSQIEKISNTTLPMIFDSLWAGSGMSFLARYIEEGEKVTNFYTELKRTATATTSKDVASTGETDPEYELRGRSVWSGARDVVLSPKKDRVFAWYGDSTSSSGGRGLIGTLDEKTSSQVFASPITEFNIDWPTESTVTLTTKGTAYGSGIMYGLDTRTRELKKIIPSTRGLSALMSKDGTSVFVSSTRGSGIESAFYDIALQKNEESVFRTMPEKCVWSTLRTKEIYCAVPTEITEGEYPDDWYKGNISFNDQIWHLDRETGQVHLLSNPLKDEGAIIDAIELRLDPKENFLYFVNKRDLTLWSLDLAK